ncbi:aminotransferase class V-fold PLP-dependent enzyme [soil metagenome]
MNRTEESTDDLPDRARALDDADPLASYRAQLLSPDDSDVVAYFDGNSLGRPLQGTADHLARFVHDQWAGRLIRGWTDGWLDWPERVGDHLGRVALGAAAGQVVVADSTTVLLYKLARAGVAARAGRRQIVLDTNDFPTDRYVLEGIADERGLELAWIDTDPAAGVTAEQVAAVAGSDTALVSLSHVTYRSGWMADGTAITQAVHDAGALMLWDLSHSVGSVELALDDWGVDLAVGCTYKYLNGGPGSPAFGYVRKGLQDQVQQPILGWIGRRDAFEMGPGYDPAPGLRSLLSGTPPILAMVPLSVSLDLLEQVGIVLVRAKSVQLTEFALELTDAWLVDLGVEVVSPRDSANRGGHITLYRAGFAAVVDELWSRGVIPDFREPDSIRIGLSPLTTSFAEVHRGMSVLRDVIDAQAD